jgi:hypothetical protein
MSSLDFKWFVFPDVKLPVEQNSIFLINIGEMMLSQSYLFVLTA